ncbi:hypothetical protein JCM10213v2_004601 [Rhodosporidiobolus nylandii]
MSIDPSLLMSDPGAAAGQPEQEDEDDAFAEGEFQVERILDYDIKDNEQLGTPAEEWKPQGARWEVRYLVKWKGYDESDNTWEPKRNFVYWDPEYDKTLKLLHLATPGRKKPAELDKEAERKNAKWVQEEKDAAKKEAKRITGGATLQGKRKKEKKDKGKGKEKEKARPSTSRASDAGSSSSRTRTPSSLAAPAPRKTRTTRVSGDDVIDPEALEDMYKHGNLPAELRALRRTPPPKHDEHGNIIFSSSGSEGQSSVSPQVEVQQLPPARRFPPAPQPAPTSGYGSAPPPPPQQQGFAAASASASALAQQYYGALPLQQQGGAAHGQEQAHGVASGAQLFEPGGFAANSDDEGQGYGGGYEQVMDYDQQRAPAVEPAGFAGSSPEADVGFAGSDDDDGNAGKTSGFLSMTDVSANLDSVSAGVGQSQKEEEVSGFATSEDEEDGDEKMQDVRPATAPLPAKKRAPTPVSDGFAGSSDDEEEQPAPRPAVAGQRQHERGAFAGGSDGEALEQNQADVGFAGSDDEDEPMRQAPPQEKVEGYGGFAGSDDEEDQPMGQLEVKRERETDGERIGFAGSDEEETAQPSPRHKGKGSGGFAGSDDEDEPVQPAVSATPAVPAAAPPVPSAQPNGFASADESSEDDVPLAVSTAAAVPPVPARALPRPASRTPLPRSRASSRTRAPPAQKPSSRPSSVARVAASGSRSRESSQRPVKRAPTPPSSSPEPDEGNDREQERTEKEAKDRAELERRERQRTQERVKERARESLPPPGKEGVAHAQPPKKKRRAVIASSDEDEELSTTKAGPKKPLLSSLKISQKSATPLPRRPSDLVPAASPSTAATGAAASATFARGSPVASAGESGSRSAAQKEKSYDPFNDGVVRPASKDGYIPLNLGVLRVQKLADRLNRQRKPYPADAVTEIDKIHHLWQLKLGNNPLDGTACFDQIMIRDAEGNPREAYITEPPTENAALRDKFDRRARTDYLALQYVLASLEGVKQADEPRASVNAVFVHISKMSELGKFPGKLVALEHFRERDDVVFFSYGETTEGKRVFRQFWLPTSTITFTPSALLADPDRLAALLKQQAEQRDEWRGARSAWPWLPLQYLLAGGAFGFPVDAEGNKLPLLKDPEPSMRTAKRHLHIALYEDRLSIARVYPLADAAASPDPLFPRSSDRMDYAPAEWEAIESWHRPKYCKIGVAELQELVRRWVVVATPEEIASCPAAPGVTLVTLSDAEALLDKPMPVIYT